MKLSLVTATSLGLGLALWPAVIVVGAEEQSLRRLGRGNGNGNAQDVSVSTACGGSGSDYPNCSPCCTEGKTGSTFKSVPKGDSGECSLICIDNDGGAPTAKGKSAIEACDVPCVEASASCDQTDYTATCPT